MTAPTTQRDEIRQLLAAATEDGQITLSEPEVRAMFKYLDHMFDREAA